jgi:hypothetical protein
LSSFFFCHALRFPILSTPFWGDLSSYQPSIKLLSYSSQCRPNSTARLTPGYPGLRVPAGRRGSVLDQVVAHLEDRYHGVEIADILFRLTAVVRIEASEMLDTCAKGNEDTRARHRAQQSDSRWQRTVRAHNP